jgi:hypothetical protein
MLSERDGLWDRIAGKRIGRLVAVPFALLAFMVFTGQARAQVTGAGALGGVAAASTQPIVTTAQSSVAASAIATLPQSGETAVAPVSKAVTQSVGSVVSPATKVVAPSVGSTTQSAGSLGSVVAPATKVVAQSVGSTTQSVGSVVAPATKVVAQSVGSTTQGTVVSSLILDKPRRPGHRRPSVCELRFLRRRWLTDPARRNPHGHGHIDGCWLLTAAAGAPARAARRIEHRKLWLRSALERLACKPVA